MSVVVWAPALAQSGPSSPLLPELDLTQALQIAVDSNPGLAEMRARSQAAADIPSQLGTLPDPKLNLNALSLPVDTFSLGQEAMTQMQIGVSQSFPFPGKLRLRREVATHESEAASQSVEEARLRLLRDVKNVWWELAYLGQAITIVGRNMALTEQFIDIANSRYSVGKGLQQDVLLGQVERGRLHDRLIQLQGMHGAVAARLNALLDRPQNTAFRLPTKVDETLPELIGPERFLEEAGEQRPLLAAMESLVNAARANRDLAEKSFYPDFTLGANYGFRTGRNTGGGERADLFSIMLSVDVPLYAKSKQRRLLSQRRHELIGKSDALLDAGNRVEADIMAAWYDYQRAHEQVQLLLTGIIPQSRQTVESMLAGYQVNKVDFLNLVQSQVTLYNFEQQYWRTLTQAHQALAELAAASGRESIDDK